MQLEAGMRVRCTDNWGGFGDVLQIGREYQVSGRDRSGLVLLNEFPTFGFVPARFKPIVRVKMGRAVA